MLKIICNFVGRLLGMSKNQNSIGDDDKFDYVDFVYQLKKKKKGLMSKRQYLAVAKKLSDVSPCNLLVFGLGEDSYLWNKINKGGVTIFLEDCAEWIDKVNDGSLQVRHISYNTKVVDHAEIGFDEEKLKLKLPEDVSNLEYDFIIVDAPLGHQPPRPFKGPGRMSSIYAASKLLKSGGTAVVDDMGRLVEETYAFHYFGESNLTDMIEKKVGVFKTKLKC